MSITFVGFMVTQNGDLIDPAHRGILKAAILTKELYTGLKQNRVNFDEDYRHWKKDAMIGKIGTVMGLNFIHDPDPTYVLTVDNLIKILAIQMRFRCVCVCMCMYVCVGLVCVCVCLHACMLGSVSVVFIYSCVYIRDAYIYYVCMHMSRCASYYGTLTNK